MPQGLRLPYDVAMQEDQAEVECYSSDIAWNCLYRIHFCPCTEVRAHDHRSCAYQVLWQHLSYLQSAAIHNSVPWLLALKVCLSRCITYE